VCADGKVISDQISAIRKKEKDYTEFTEKRRGTVTQRSQRSEHPDRVGVNAGTEGREERRRVAWVVEGLTPEGVSYRVRGMGGLTV